MVEPVDLLATIEKIRNQIAKLQDKTMVGIAKSYRSSIKQFDSDIELLSQKIADGIKANELKKLDVYNRTINETSQALDDFGKYLTLDLRREAANMIDAGTWDSRLLLEASSMGIDLGFRMLPKEILTELGHYINPGEPLYNRLQLFSATNTENITNTMFNMIGSGYNPKTIARAITNAYGTGLTDAMRMMRTVQIYSYRDAAQANYINNSDVVRGWIWYAKLDGATCLSCVAQHGSFHPVTEKLNDHHNGRCVPVPSTRLSAPFIKDGAGEQWFNGLPPATQAQMMGQKKYDAWKDNKFDFKALSVEKKNDVFGMMKTEASVKELVHE